MKTKRLENTETVERIKGHTSRLLVLKCPDQRSVFPSSPCTNGGCEYAIKKPGYMNCTFVAATAEEDVGGKRRGMTLREIGEAEGLSHEGVRQIELSLLRKLRALVDPEDHVDPTTRQPGLAARRGHVAPSDEGHERSNEDDVVRAVADRKLG